MIIRRCWGRPYCAWKPATLPLDASNCQDGSHRPISDPPMLIDADPHPHFAASSLDPEEVVDHPAQDCVVVAAGAGPWPPTHLKALDAARCPASGSRPVPPQRAKVRVGGGSRQRRRRENRIEGAMLARALLQRRSNCPGQSAPLPSGWLPAMPLLGGFHGEYSRFPGMVPTGYSAGPQGVDIQIDSPHRMACSARRCAFENSE